MANLLEKARKAKGLTQTQVGEAVGRNQSTVSKWEMGSYLPDRDAAPKLAEVLGLTIVEVLYPDLAEPVASPAKKRKAA